MTPREEWRLATRVVGRRVLLFDCVDSTSTRAAALAGDPENEGLVLVAEQQTAGRGRQGRTWRCPPGQGILLSTLLFPPYQLRRPALLTAWAAVAVCQAIQDATGLPTRIKWPNDILIGTRKVCGILIEQGRATVAGIGLNVNQTAESLTDLPDAGSLAVFAGHAFDRRELTRKLIYLLDEWYDRLCRGAVAALETAWRERLALLGRMVTVTLSDSTLSGRLRSLSFHGIEIELAEGRRCTLKPEEMLGLKSASDLSQMSRSGTEKGHE